MFIHEMTKEECQESLKRANFGRLGCARDDQPYVVPISFAFEEDYAYAFSMAGQKIEWMRDNPHVCLAVDTVKSWNDWTSVVGLGRYEELSDTPEWRVQRELARKLLDARATWWQPGSVAIEGRPRDRTPIVYRIYLERMTGRRGVPAPDETTAVVV